MMNLTVILSAAIYMGTIDLNALENEAPSLGSVKQIAVILNNKSLPTGWFGNPLDVVFVNDGSIVGEKYNILNISLSNDALNKLNDSSNPLVDHWTKRFEDLIQNLIVKDLKSSTNFDDIRSYKNRERNNTISTPGTNLVTTPKEGIFSFTADFLKTVLKKLPSPINIFNNAKVGIQNILNRLPEIDNTTQDTNDIVEPEDIEDQNFPYLVLVNGEYNKKSEITKGKPKNMKDKDPKDKQLKADFLNSIENVDYAIELDTKPTIKKVDEDNNNLSPTVGTSNEANIGETTPKSDDENAPATRIIGGSSSLKYTPVQNKFRGDNMWGWGW